MIHCSDTYPAVNIRCLRLMVWSIALTLLVGCDDAGTDRQAKTKQAFAAEPLTKRIVAVSYPLQWVTQQIAGDQYNVSFPGAGAVDPTTWRPDRQKIADMQAADLIIANGTGATYAKWLPTVSLPESKLISTASRGLALSDFIMVEDIRLVHSHGPEGEHSHPTMISETWLAPVILKKQALYIKSQLSKTYPDDASKFSANFKSLEQSLDSLAATKTDAKIPSVVITATPQMKFLTRSLKIEDLHLNWNLKTPADSANAALTELLEATTGEAPSVIVFPAKLKALAERLKPMLAAHKLSAVYVDLLENPDPQRALVDRIRTNIQTLLTAVDSAEH